MSRQPQNFARERNRATPPGFAAGAAETALERQVLDALHHAPEVSVPADFAAVVARHACAHPQPRLHRLPGWGPRLVAASGVLLTAAMFAVAPMAEPSWHNGWFDAQVLLLTELGGLLWFAQRLLVND